MPILTGTDVFFFFFFSLRLLAVPDHRRLLVEHRSLGALAVDGDDVYWIEARPAEAGRQVMVPSTRTGRRSTSSPPRSPPARRSTSTAAAPSRSTTAGCASPTSPTSACTASDGAAAEPITPAPATRRPRYADAIRHGHRLVCVRERHQATATWSTTIVVLAADGRGRARRHRPRLLCRAPHQPRRPPGLADLGPPEHALGRHRAVGRTVAAGGRRPAVPRSRSSSPWAPDGSLLALGPHRLVEPLPLTAERAGRAGGGRVRRPSGSSGSRPTPRSRRP